MIRFLVYLFFFYIGFKVLKKLFSADKKTVTKTNRPLNGEETFKDPVCGTYVSKDDAVVGRLDGKRYYFCSMDCLDKFQDKITEAPKSNNGGA